MSLFLVYVREDKENKPAVRMEPYYGGAYDPPESVWCADIVVAKSRGQAKYLFISDWAGGRLYSPVYHDDWNLLRVRLLSHDDNLDEDARWLRVHEVLDHGSRPCDCPELDEEADDAQG